MTMEILTLLTGQPVLDARDVITTGFNPITQGCLIKATKVYSICKGIVIDIGIDPKNDTYSITVQVTPYKWVRYCNLSSYDIKLSQTINKGDFVGLPTRGIMKLEYCNNMESTHAVRLNGDVLYKHNPTTILFNTKPI